MRGMLKTNKKMIALIVVWVLFISLFAYTLYQQPFATQDGDTEPLFIRGLQGDDGAQGDRGEKGEKGDEGDRGYTGGAGEDAIQPATYTIYQSGSTFYADAAVSSGLSDFSGTDAAIVIQAAIDATSSGRIFIKEGTFLLKSTQTVTGVGGADDSSTCLRIPTDIELWGSGFGTILRQDVNVNSEHIISSAAHLPGDSWENQQDHRIRITNLQIDANIDNQDYTGFPNTGFKANGIIILGNDSRLDNLLITNCGMYGAICLYGSYNLIENVIVEETKYLSGIDYSIAYACGIWVSSFHCYGNILRGITVRNCDGHGIFLEDAPNNTLITDFNIYNCSDGISLQAGYNTEISTGTISRCRSVGIQLVGDDHSISNVHIEECEAAGIYVFSGRAIITLCILKNNLQTDDTNSGAIGIHVDASGAIISSCLIYDDQATPTQRGIQAFSSVIISNINLTRAVAHGVRLRNVQDSIIQGSRITGCPGFGILEDAGSDYNIITNNDLRGNVAGGASLLGVNSIVDNNLGFVTENSGTAIILNTQTTVTVNHGLAGTPTVVIVTGEHAETSDAIVTSKTATQIVITVPGAVTADRTVNWYVEYNP